LTQRWFSEGDVAFPGGETGNATRHRGLAALRRFAAAQPHRRIGVSTHGAMVRQLMKHALPPGSPPAPTRNTVLYILSYEPDADRLILVEKEELELY
jgi:broad specificity phosphatase PhoE